MSKGDILKASGEMRPLIQRHLAEFSVLCDKDERVRIRKIADSVSDYDPAGEFAYLMYAGMLALGDPDVDDYAAQVYYNGSIGDRANSVADSYMSFLEMFHEIAKKELGSKKQMLVELASKGETFESTAIVQMRRAFMESSIFKGILDSISDELRDTLLKGVSSGDKKYYMIAKQMHKNLENLLASLGSSAEAKEIKEKIDDECPIDSAIEATSTMLEFSASELPKALMQIMGMLSGMDDELDVDEINKEIAKRFDTHAEDIGDSMMYIRRITLHVTAFYMLIGSGNLGLSASKNLAYSIRDAIKNATEMVERKQTNVLELERQTAPELAISLN